MNAQRYRRHAVVLCLAFVAVAYLPHTVRVLRADDFIRVMDNPTLNPEYFRDLLLTSKTDEFYRPLNHLSFGLCHHLFGLRPGGYAALNLALVIGCVLLLFSLLEALTASASLAAWSVFAWLLNVDIVLMPLLWASGRTTTLAAFFVLLSAWAVVRSRSRGGWWLPVVCGSALLALLAKESATAMVVLLPLLAWWRERREPSAGRRAAVVALGVLAALLAYAWLRSMSGAVLPWTAPQHYRYDPSVGRLVANLFEFLAGSLVFSGLALPALLVVQRVRGSSSRGKLLFSRRELIAVGLGLFVVGMAPTLALPHRSSLYPFLPSAFVVFAVVGSTLRIPGNEEEAGRIRRRSLAAMAVLALCVTPFAWLEGRGWVRENRQVHDWSLEIVPTVVASGAQTVAIRYDPSSMGPGALGPRDLEYLGFALQAHTGRVVSVLVNPGSAPEGTPWWELVPNPAGRRPTGIRPLARPPGPGSRQEEAPGGAGGGSEAVPSGRRQKLTRALTPNVRGVLVR